MCQCSVADQPVTLLRGYDVAITQGMAFCIFVLTILHSFSRSLLASSAHVHHAHETSFAVQAGKETASL